MAKNVFNQDYNGLSDYGIRRLANGILAMDRYITEELEPKTGVAQITWKETGKKSKTWVKKKK